MDSPLLKGGIIRPEDLSLGIKVLSSESVEDVLTKPTFMDSLHYYLMCWSHRYFNYVLSGVKCHFEDSTSWPEVMKKEESVSDGSGVPWVCSVIASLVKCGVPLKDAMTMPEGQAIWLHISVCISDGAQVDILSSELEEELRKAFIEDYKMRNPETANANECD